MSEDHNANIGPNNKKRRVLFAIGILIGLLLGSIVTMLLVDWLDYKRPTVVKVLDPSPAEGTKDTVVNYVIHKYEVQNEIEEESPADSLLQDSIMIEEDNSDLMLDEDVIRELQAEETDPQNVLEEKMLKKGLVKVIYLDENKHVITAPAQAAAQWQVQQWTTPIKNKIAYQLSNNTLKVKGLDIENISIAAYDNHFYLLSGSRVYNIKPNKQFERLVETSEIKFNLK